MDSPSEQRSDAASEGSSSSAVRITGDQVYDLHRDAEGLGQDYRNLMAAFPNDTLAFSARGIPGPSELLHIENSAGCLMNKISRRNGSAQSDSDSDEFDSDLVDIDDEDAMKQELAGILYRYENARSALERLRILLERQYANQNGDYYYAGGIHAADKEWKVIGEHQSLPEDHDQPEQAEDEKADDGMFNVHSSLEHYLRVELLRQFPAVRTCLEPMLTPRTEDSNNEEGGVRLS
ncbi:unnamed protein product [Sphagnum balticum]